MKALRQHVMASRNVPFNIQDHLVDPIEEALTKRWSWIVVNTDCDGTPFNLHVIHDRELYYNQDVQMKLMRAFYKPSTIDEEFEALKTILQLLS
jgi:hypothetical protein